MTAYRIPQETHLGSVELTVSDLDRSVSFYRDILGFAAQSDGVSRCDLSAGEGGSIVIRLVADPQASRKPPHTTGLYHFAVRVPDRRSLGEVIRRIFSSRWPVQGFADHSVSEAVYLADPDGNGIEVYVDRPESDWKRGEDGIFMTTEELDVEDLLAETGSELRPTLPPGTDMGHVHLHVSDLRKAERFYHDVLGFDVTQRSYPGALFLSAGGYHHHVGTNIWAGRGAPAPPPESVGLRSFSIVVPSEEDVGILRDRLRQAGRTVDERRTSGGCTIVRAADDDGNDVTIQSTIHP